MSETRTLPVPGSVGAYWLAIRPRTLPASLAPVVLGVSLARPSLAGASAIAIALGAVLLQIVSNLANDLFDFERGRDTAQRLGPPRAAQLGLLSPTQLRWALLLTSALALLLGSYLVALGGWLIVGVGLSSLLAALAYTAGPYPLGPKGLGDLFAFLFFGPVAVLGTVYLLSAPLSGQVWLASAVPGLLVTNILVVNNLRDHAEDQQTGKQTLAVRFGPSWVIGEYGLLLLLAMLACVALAFWRHSAWPSLPLLLVPRGIQLWASVRTQRGRPLNRVLASTAALALLVSGLLSLGLWLS